MRRGRRNQGSLSAYKPTLRDKIENGLTAFLGGGQKGAAWNFQSPNASPMRNKAGEDVATGYKYDLGQPISREEYERFGPQVEEAFGDQVGLLPDPSGMRLAKFYGDDVRLADFVDQLRKNNPDLPRPMPTTQSGNYMQNNWETPEGRFGGEYVEGLQGLNLPDLEDGFNASAPRIAEKIVTEIDPDLMRGAGLVGSQDRDRLLRTIAGEGWAGVVRLVNSQKGSVEAKEALLASIAGLGVVGATQMPEEAPTGL